MLASSKLELNIDAARLTISNSNTLPETDDIESHIKSETQNAIQKFIGILRNFERVENKEGQELYLMPPSKIKLPREKPIPEQPELTTWQKFALSKNIKPKSRRASIVFDEEKQEWVKRWGFRAANSIKKDKAREETKIIEDHNEHFREENKKKTERKRKLLKIIMNISEKKIKRKPRGNENYCRS